MIRTSRVIGTVLLGFAAFVQMSGGTATGVTAAAQGFPGAPSRGGGFGGRFGGVRRPLALVEMFLFVAILFVGYVYVWKKGALEWD